MQKMKRMISRRWDGTSKENGSSRSTCSWSGGTCWNGGIWKLILNVCLGGYLVRGEKLWRIFLSSINSTIFHCWSMSLHGVEYHSKPLNIMSFCRILCGQSL